MLIAFAFTFTSVPSNHERIWVKKYCALFRAEQCRFAFRCTLCVKLFSEMIRRWTTTCTAARATWRTRTSHQPSWRPSTRRPLTAISVCRTSPSRRSSLRWNSPPITTTATRRATAILTVSYSSTRTKDWRYAGITPYFSWHLITH